MLEVVWLKRDLRLHDHKPLTEALKSGQPILVMYIAEPSIWLESELSARHFQFVKESLNDLQNQFKEKGGSLAFAVGEMEEILEAIYAKYGDFVLHAHEENGTPLTFKRDLRVHKWMKERQLTFNEYQHYGVVRRLKSRDDFHDKWKAFMKEKVLPSPNVLSTVDPAALPEPLTYNIDILNQLEVSGPLLGSGQVGGERESMDIFKSFLRERSKKYQFHISKPLRSSISCSRLSPYIAWGNLSVRFIVQKTQSTMAKLEDDQHKNHLNMFMSRMHWHCHFIQRIEDDPEITNVTINKAFDEVREKWNEEVFDRWYQGQTGIPMIDASMRALHEIGWINFRSRAMVVSFICNTMLLDWRKPADALAGLFLDYEPGIHYSQVQMQAATTGFNTIRIYNPIKQGIDHDPTGAFIRKYIPELRGVSNEFIHTPWESGQELNGYPEPMVDIQQANQHARSVLWSVKQTKDAKEIAETKLKKHGSRQFPGKKKAKDSSGGEQLSLDLFE
ncbi:deoxyribodipyrimidine photo-lyase/cryptochrome family protein [Jeotgalibacillus proteolyticus]|uniref:cryptochrome/deoxyribodipyrimidine photo-lyase family protein n=1 Tax=Jeotgalibacillus proteolyticus TaxID=2082395 RepID=UPI003CEF43D6